MASSPGAVSVHLPHWRSSFAWRSLVTPEGQRDAASDDQIVGTLACMVDGVILAHTVGGKDSAEVLDACHEFLRRNSRRSAKRSSSSQTKPRRPQGTTARLKRAGATLDSDSGSPDQSLGSRVVRVKAAVR